MKDYGDDIPLTTKFLQYIPCGSSACKWEICTVAEVCSESYYIDKDVQSAHDVVI